MVSGVMAFLNTASGSVRINPPSENRLQGLWGRGQTHKDSHVSILLHPVCYVLHMHIFASFLRECKLVVLVPRCCKGIGARLYCVADCALSIACARQLDLTVIWAGIPASYTRSVCVPAVANW